MHEEEQLHDDKKTGSDALKQAGEVLGQCAQSAMDVEVLCMDHLRKSSDTRDSTSEAATLCKPGKTHALIRDEAQVLSSADPKATETPHLGRSLPYLDLSVIPTEFLLADSCGTVECNVDLNLSSQKQPDLAAPKTMWDSLDSTSRNNATVLHELSPPEMSAVCKDDDKVSPLFSKEITPKKQCMQLFSEEKTSDIFRSVTTQPVAAASIASGQRRNSSDVQPIPASAHFPSRTLSLKPENLSEMQHSDLPRAIYRQYLRHKLVHDRVGFSLDSCEETWKGQLGCYVKGSKIALLIMEGGRDLAERWEEEQSKLLSGICVPQFKYSIAQGSSLDYHYFLGPKTGIWKENTAYEPGLSFGNVDACRGGNAWRRPLFQPAYVCNNGNEHLQRPISYTEDISFWFPKGEV
ncbi:unnamed protein product [Prunus armeniaca]